MSQEDGGYWQVNEDYIGGVQVIRVDGREWPRKGEDERGHDDDNTPTE